MATLLALLLAWGLNHYFIRSRLVKRFTALNQAVVQIGLGRTEATIPVYGRDELGRIAGLLRHTPRVSLMRKTAAGTGDWRAKSD